MRWFGRCQTVTGEHTDETWRPRARQTCSYHDRCSRTTPSTDSTTHRLALTTTNALEQHLQPTVQHTDLLLARPLYRLVPLTISIKQLTLALRHYPNSNKQLSIFNLSVWHLLNYVNKILRISGKASDTNFLWFWVSVKHFDAVLLRDRWRKKVTRCGLYLIVKSQSEFWHSRQVDTHLDGSDNLAPQHVATRTHQQVHWLHNVQEHLVLTVLQTLGPPWHGIRHCHRRLWSNLKLVTFLCDVFLQYLTVCHLSNQQVH